MKIYMEYGYTDRLVGSVEADRRWHAALQSKLRMKMILFFLLCLALIIIVVANNFGYIFIPRAQ